MRAASTIFLTSVALIAFAGNSLLCRVALGHGLIDASSFTAIRLASGALMTSLILFLTSRGRSRPAGSWPSALALFCYAAFFSFAYLQLPAGVGALILFGSVQATMIGWDVVRGHKPHVREWVGLVLALVGLVGLNAPGIHAPDIASSVLMAAAGASWGVYSIRGRTSGEPLASTAGNFAMSLVFIPLFFLKSGSFALAEPNGVWIAVASGALTSGLGYAIWYTALKHLRAATAGIVQLLVPPIAALGGVVVLGEILTLRLLACGGMILLGVFIAIGGFEKK